MEISERLHRAGYRRSSYVTGLIADRLIDMANVLTPDGLGTLRKLLQAESKPELDAFLLRIRGVGSFVLESFKLLYGWRKNPSSR